MYNKFKKSRMWGEETSGNHQAYSRGHLDNIIAREGGRNYNPSQKGLGHFPLFYLFAWKLRKTIQIPIKRFSSRSPWTMLKSFDYIIFVIHLWLPKTNSVPNVLARIVRATRFSCNSLEKMISGYVSSCKKVLMLYEVETLSTDRIFQLFTIGKLSSK